MVAAVGFDQGVVLLSVGVERFDQFWSILDGISVIVAVGFGQGVVLLEVGLERFDAFGRYFGTKLRTYEFQSTKL